MPDYRSDGGLLAHLQKQDAVIGTYKDELGIGNEEISELHNDFLMLDWILGRANLVTEFEGMFFGVKKLLVRGEKDASLGAFADAPDLTLPAGLTLVAGIEKRSRERDALYRLKASEAARQALDLVDAPANLSPDDVKAIIDAVSAAAFGYMFALIVSGRGKSDMWEVQIRRKGSETWQTIGSATGKSADFTITPTTPGAAEQIEVRVILKKNNAAYGQPSNPTYVTLNP
jgi:hypothetical protein